MNIPDHLRYLESHEWIEFKPGEPCAVGISDHAQGELSDVVYVELPEVGRVVEKGDPIAVVESVKAASDIYAPVGGEIVEVNHALEGAPETVNTDPYGEGWLVRIRPAPDADFGGLLDAGAYREIIG